METTVKSAGRTIELLEIIAGSKHGITFSELLSIMDIPRSSLHKLIQELLNRKYLSYNRFTKTYSSGIKFLQTSTICINSVNVLQDIWMTVRQLSEEFKAISHAGTLDGRFVTYIAKAEASHEISLVTRIGMRKIAYVSSMGKVLLSQYSEKKIAHLFANIKNETNGEFPPVDVDKLIEDLRQIKEQGFAYDKYETSEAYSCISVPIYGTDKEMIAAISVTVPSYRIDDEFKERAIARMKMVCAELSAKMSYAN